MNLIQTIEYIEERNSLIITCFRIDLAPIYLGVELGLKGYQLDQKRHCGDLLNYKWSLKSIYLADLFSET